MKWNQYNIETELRKAGEKGFGHEEAQTLIAKRAAELDKECKTELRKMKCEFRGMSKAERRNSDYSRRMNEMRDLIKDQGGDWNEFDNYNNEIRREF